MVFLDVAWSRPFRGGVVAHLARRRPGGRGHLRGKGGEAAEGGGDAAVRGDEENGAEAAFYGSMESSF